jgi:hypothetical protein
VLYYEDIHLIYTNISNRIYNERKRSDIEMGQVNSSKKSKKKFHHKSEFDSGIIDTKKKDLDLDSSGGMIVQKGVVDLQGKELSL